MSDCVQVTNKIVLILAVNCMRQRTLRDEYETLFYQSNKICF